MTTRLILIRHGQTEWNLKKRYCGSTDLGLSLQGRRQVKMLYQRLANEGIHNVYASNKRRALQTAKILFGGFKINKEPDLREIYFGAFEGLNHKQIKKRFGLIYEKWLKNPYVVTIPKGENLKDFKERIVGALNRIVRANKNKTVAVVSHGGVISVFLNHILKSKGFWKHIPASASITIVEFRDRRVGVELFNDISHLNNK